MSERFSSSKCDTSFIPNPSYYNLTQDFIFIETKWGALFYKPIGKMKRTQAKQYCSEVSEGVHVPIPRFQEENDFYGIYFGDEDLWLGISDIAEEGVFTSDQGYAFTKTIVQSNDLIVVNDHNWINSTFSINTEMNGVKMTTYGKWEVSYESELLSSICVYNIIPSECSKCLHAEFCRYQDQNRLDVQCVCPSTRKGHYCEKNICSKCSNGGHCSINDITKEIKCLCQYPFHGENCELGRNFFLFQFIYDILDAIVLFMTTFRKSNRPMVIDAKGELYIVCTVGMASYERL